MSSGKNRSIGDGAQKIVLLFWEERRVGLGKGGEREMIVFYFIDGEHPFSRTNCLAF